MRADRLAHQFVNSFPDLLEPGVLYLSLQYDTTAHLCACACGSQVILPLHPTAWRFTYDGASVSISPSVGNWSFPCRSHYWIERGRIRWSTSWTNDEVQAGRNRTLRERTGESAPSTSSIRQVDRRPCGLGWSRSCEASCTICGSRAAASKTRFGHRRSPR